MSRLFRREERRSITSLPWIQGGEPRSAVTQEQALTLAPVFASVRHITDFGSTLPLKGYRKAGEQRQSLDTLPKLFRDLEVRGELVPWLSQAFSSLATRGNAVGLIVATDAFGFPTNITWLPMEKVSVDDSSGVGKWYVEGRQVPRMDLVHIPWITMPGKTLALSPIAYFASTINAGLDAQSYGGDWFHNGGFPPSVFRNTRKSVDSKQSGEIRQRLVQSIRKREPLVTGADWEYTPITIPPGEAQFIETQKLSANQIASIYGIAPEECGGEPANSLTYQNEEHRQTVRAHNLRPYLSRFEHAFASWLPNRQYVRFNVDGILRSDAKTRAEIREIDRRIGFRSVDEMRATEDLPPLPDGQGTHFLPQAAPPQEPQPSQDPPQQREGRLKLLGGSK